MKNTPYTSSAPDTDGEVWLFNSKGKWVIKCRNEKIADELLKLINGELS